MGGRTTMVETARGPMPVDDLGRVLAHEHVFVLSPEILQNYPEVWGDEDERVTEVMQHGEYLKATKDVVLKHGGLWFQDESFVVVRNDS